jgi:hypothetical protein
LPRPPNASPYFKKPLNSKALEERGIATTGIGGVLYFGMYGPLKFENTYLNNYALKGPSNIASYPY